MLKGNSQKLYLESADTLKNEELALIQGTRY